MKQAAKFFKKDPGYYFVFIKRFNLIRLSGFKVGAI